MEKGKGKGITGTFSRGRLLPRIWLPPCHHIEIRIAVDVTVLNAFPHIDEKDLDLWF